MPRHGNTSGFESHRGHPTSHFYNFFPKASLSQRNLTNTAPLGSPGIISEVRQLRSPGHNRAYMQGVEDLAYQHGRDLPVLSGSYFGQPKCQALTKFEKKPPSKRAFELLALRMEGKRMV